MSSFTVHHDPFNGATLRLNSADISSQEIASLKSELIRAKKALIWVTVAIEQAALVARFTQHDFVFHLCNETSLTLICRLQENAYAPFAPTHTLGVGGLVQNAAGEVLLVRDRWMNGKGLKLPGGYVDLGEPIHRAAQREVFEETGVVAQFKGIVGVVSKHPHQFAKSNQYVVCQLDPQQTQINIQDTDEIELATWVKPAKFIADESCSRFHRHLVKNLLNQPSIEWDNFQFDAVDDSEKFIYSMNHNNKTNTKASDR